MSDLLLLCIEFFKTGLFSVGGGLATLPFLGEISRNHPEWFSMSDLANIVAVSESTPGPMGINMATFAGFTTHGIMGGILATLSLVFPSFIVVLIVSRIWEKYKTNEKVMKIFAALRAAAIGLIISAGFTVFLSAIFKVNIDDGIVAMFKSYDYKCIILFVIMMAATQVKKLSKLHPVIYIAIAAVIGIIFSF